VVVAGGANLDLRATGSGPLVDGTSNPGTLRRSPGGVARNIAENLARLGTPVHLVAAVGRDAAGDELLSATAAVGVDVERVRRVPAPTGTYTAILHPTGELAIAVSDMAATESLTAEEVEGAEDLIAQAAYLVLDANLPSDALAAGLDLAARHGVPVLVDPVSVAKSARVGEAMSPTRPVHTLTPNTAELAAMTELPTATEADAVVAARALHQRGAHRVWVRRGAAGSVLVAADAEPLSIPPEPMTPDVVIDVSGAGDAMLAAYCHALLSGHAAGEAASYGQRAAALTVAVTATVRPDLRERLDELDEEALR